jgi:hypothetical protein
MASENVTKSLRISPELWARVEKEADDRMTSTSAIVIFCIKKGMKFLPPPLPEDDEVEELG